MFKVGEKVERPHPHRPEENLKLKIVKVEEDYSFAESSEGEPFVIFHSEFKPDKD